MLGFINSLCLERRFRYKVILNFAFLARFSKSLACEVLASECIFNFKMTFTSSRFSFTFRYWRSFWSPQAAAAE